MSVKKEEKQILLNVIDYIKGIYNKENFWSVKTEKLITLLEIDQTEFYRQLYVLNDKIHFSHAVDIFNAQNVGDLITILEALTYKQAEYVFKEAGLFLSNEQRLELMELFLDNVNSCLKNHQPQYEDFLAMYHHTGTAVSALELYFGHYFDLDMVVRELIDHYVQKHTTGFAFRNTAGAYFDELFFRHVINKQDLFVSLELKLRSFLKTVSGGTHTGPEIMEEDESAGKIRDARKIMQLSSCHFTKKQLRHQYKYLMKHYHPDINPRGLEMSKQINSAYSLLLTVSI
ncbi:MAG: J domain-containing protein [Spirochaetales bacterium]|nr:J domain-containing protein [Spirochaetales bacterium]